MCVGHFNKDYRYISYLNMSWS